MIHKKLEINFFIGVFDFINLFSINVVLLFLAFPAAAQPIISDESTLTSVSSDPLDPNSFEIGGGARRGNFLFHSFSQFNIGQSQEAYFQPDGNIENIFSRITGSGRSEIFGTLGVDGTANLFFLNPNGILFGPGANLDLRGSFLATTASSFEFEGGFEFNADRLHAIPMNLAIKLPLNLNFRGSDNSIALQSDASLKVDPSKTLALVGGDVSLSGKAEVNAPGGNVEIAGFGSNNSIALNVTSAGFSLEFDARELYDANLRDITVLGSPILITADSPDSSSNGGSIGFIGKDIMLNGSQIGQPSEVNDSGPISFIATDSIETESVDIVTLTIASANAGDISFTAPHILFGPETNISARTTSDGQGGGITIIAGQDLTVDGGGVDGGGMLLTNISASSGGKGSAGRILIHAPSFRLLDGGQIDISSRGSGGAGQLEINSQDVEISGVGAITELVVLPPPLFVGRRVTLRPSRLLATTSGDGNGGTIEINSHSLALSGGAEINSSVNDTASGEGGKISLYLNELFLDNQSRIAASTAGTGNAGQINIQVDGSTRLIESEITGTVTKTGVGQGSKIDIQTGQLNLEDSAIAASTANQGDAGNIRLVVRDSASFSDRSQISAAIERGASADKSSSIGIQARQLLLDGQSIITNSTAGNGDAGRIDIHVEGTTTLTDGSAILGTVDSAPTDVDRGRTIQGGDIALKTHNLFIDDNSKISTTTSGQGNAGRVNIAVWETATLDRNSTISSEALKKANGNAGSVVFAARNIRLDNGSGLSTSSTNNLDSGNIRVTTSKDLNLDNGAFIKAETAGGQGDIALFLRDLIMRRGSLISASATGEAPGGNIKIDVENLVALENSDITSNAVNNIGGNISINALGIFGTEFRERRTPESDITASSDLGPQFSGLVELNTPDLDPRNNLEELPETIVDPETLLSASPCPEGLESEFVLEGSGGIPPNPSATLTPTGLVPAELSPPSPSPDREADISSIDSDRPSKTVALENKLVPAWGWTWNDKGEVVLTAYDPTAIASQRFLSYSSTCSVN